MKFFEGRSPRSTYCAVIFGIIVGTIVGVVAHEFLGKAGLPDAVTTTLSIVFIIGCNLLSIAFGIRRLHDLDKSGWWILLFVVPLANLILGIMLLIRPGTQGDNRFGPPPA